MSKLREVKLSSLNIREPIRFELQRDDIIRENLETFLFGLSESEFSKFFDYLQCIQRESTHVNDYMNFNFKSTEMHIDFSRVKKENHVYKITFEGKTKIIYTIDLEPFIIQTIKKVADNSTLTIFLDMDVIVRTIVEDVIMAFINDAVSETGFKSRDGYEKELYDYMYKRTEELVRSIEEIKRRIFMLGLEAYRIDACGKCLF
ncbi:MAG: hypothetical protein PHC62_00665 [Candidatus Izemoplasmatales bacterium]|nr:hypothetical protein [Candidatus Izemoplasmatales bacterium]